jgi:biopolymer transport protein ExbD
MDGAGVEIHMNPNRLLELMAVPMACLFLILILCVFAIERPVSTGILIPMMHTRPEPLSNCEFNGFTVYLRSDGKFAGGERDDVITRDVLLSQIRKAKDNIQDDTIFVISDPEVPYGDVVNLIADIRNTTPPDHIAVVTRAGQVEGIEMPGGSSPDIHADRCQFAWPAIAGQPRWSTDEERVEEPIPLPGGKISIWQALRGK